MWCTPAVLLSYRTKHIQRISLKGKCLLKYKRCSLLQTRVLDSCTNTRLCQRKWGHACIHWNKYKQWEPKQAILPLSLWVHWACLSHCMLSCYIHVNESVSLSFTSGFYKQGRTLETLDEWCPFIGHRLWWLIHQGKQLCQCDGLNTYRWTSIFSLPE